MKVCDVCGTRKGGMVLSLTDQGQTWQANLCETCQDQVRLLVVDRGEAEGLRQMLGLLQNRGKTLAAAQRKAKAAVCATCKQSAHTFITNGVLGCPACYQVMEPWLMERWHPLYAGNLRHKGRVVGPPAPPSAQPELFPKGPPATPAELARLRRELAAAVAAEDYETAAALRDRLKATRPGKGKRPHGSQA